MEVHPGNCSICYHENCFIHTTAYSNIRLPINTRFRSVLIRISYNRKCNGKLHVVSHFVAFLINLARFKKPQRSSFALFSRPPMEVVHDFTPCFIVILTSYRPTPIRPTYSELLPEIGSKFYRMELAGRVLGLALLHRCLIDTFFTRTFYKMLLEQ